jgi:hypothetical protein
MQSTSNPKLSDDPHDFIVVAPDAVGVAPADQELSNLLHEAARYSSEAQTRKPADVPAVPAVDTTFRPTDVNNVLGQRSTMGKWAAKTFTAIVLASCMAGAGIAWELYGATAKAMIAQWTPQVDLTSLLPGSPAPPAAVEAAAAPSQPTPAMPTAAEAEPPEQSNSLQSKSPGSKSLETKSLETMTRDLASVSQEVEQLKATIEQLKAGQQQLSRDAANASAQNKVLEQNLRARASLVAPRAAAPVRRPPQPYPPRQQAAGAPAYPQATPYVPPAQAAAPLPQAVAPPPTLAAPQGDPSIPRPPMPVRPQF